MKFSGLLAAGTILAGAALVGLPTTASAQVCSPTFNAGACDFVITFNADGSIGTSGPGGSSIGGEDAVVGVINKTASTITSFALTGSNIYGFENDGIGHYDAGSAPIAGNPDTSTYGGPRGFFTIVDSSTGTVNFVGGIAAGKSDYFSLEAAINLTAPPVVTGPPVTTGVPEPTTMALLGAGLFGLGMVRRHRRS